MHAVGANHGIGDGIGAISKAQPNALAGLVETDELVVEPHKLIRHHARQRRMQIAAMGK